MAPRPLAALRARLRPPRRAVRVRAGPRGRPAGPPSRRPDTPCRGLDLPYLPADARATALDVVPENVRRTRVRAADLDRTVDAAVGDATDLPFEDDAFGAVCLHLLLAVVPDPAAVLAEVDRVLAPGGRVSVFDEFLPDGASPSLLRRALNPAGRLLCSDLTQQLGPPVAGTDLAVREREWLLWGLYSVALLRPAASSGRRTPDS